jgi:hypothetical protein
MRNIDTIKQAIQKSVEKRKKTATFHSQVLLHAELLEHLDPVQFCRDVGMPVTYQIEFRKMIAASRALSDLGYSIQKR